MMRTGMWRAYCWAASQPPSATKPSISALQIRRASGSSLPTSRGVKKGSSTCLCALCSGGSEVSGGAGSGGSSNLRSRRTTRREVKFSVS